MNSEMLNIEFDPQNKENIVRTLTNLSVWVESAITKADKKTALAKFDVGVAMLKASEPQNAMLKFFVNKQTEWKEKEKQKRENIGTIVLVVACVGILVLAFFLADKFMPETPDPVEYIRNLFRKN